MLTGNIRVECHTSTSGGKGNRGKCFDRCKRICAAGIPTAQADLDLKSCLQHYLLKDEADAIISDAIIPPPPPRPLPPLRHPIQPDQRHSGLNSDLASTVNPPQRTKFQALVDDLKETPYRSYWKIRLSAVPDPSPMFPQGFDIENTTYGKKTHNVETAYDLIMPKDPLPDKTPKSKEPAAQTDRKYCRPAFNPDLTYGFRTNIDKRGVYMKCCLTDERVEHGNAECIHKSAIEADMQHLKKSSIGHVLTPNKNISCVPEGYAFGILKKPENLHECLSTCTINPNLYFFRKCLAHVNSLRKVMSTRFLPSVFYKLYMSIKYKDKNNTGWVPREVVYNSCKPLVIRFDANKVEPLLCMWEAFDGSNIKYKTFTQVLNFQKPLPELPKVPDLHPDCLDFRTTYTEMVKPGQPEDTRYMAGTPSGRYFDVDYPITPDYYCKADRANLPQESDSHSCLNPSIFTLMHVSHRDMYAQRDPATVRKIFEGAGEEFTDEKFNQVWEEAKKHHPQGLVCYETFRRALDKLFPFDPIVFHTAKTGNE